MVEEDLERWRGNEKNIERQGGWGKACFLFRANETLIVNLTLSHINHTLRQTYQVCKMTPSILTVHTILKISQ